MHLGDKCRGCGTFVSPIGRELTRAAVVTGETRSEKVRERNKIVFDGRKNLERLCYHWLLHANVDCTSVAASSKKSRAQSAIYVTCVANTCTCPNGTPTVATGSGSTLCDTATVDCSVCNVGYKISATAASGSAQTCNATINIVN